MLGFLRSSDISRHQDDVDFQRLRPAIDEIIIRCAMGATGVDDRYAENWREAKWAGIPRRRTYFYVVTDIPWREQLANVHRVTGGDYGTGAIILDSERTASEKARIKAGWVFPKRRYTDTLLELAFQLGREVEVEHYSNFWEWTDMVYPDPDFRKRRFHGAGYPLSIPVTFEQMVTFLGRYQLRIPRPWSDEPRLEWHGWQCASTGRLPGIAGNVDLNFIRPLATAPVANVIAAYIRTKIAIMRDLVED